VEVGAWGALGSTETDTSFGGKRHFDVNIVGTDFQVPLSEQFLFRGEAWTGENLGDFRGGIGQSINASGDEIGSAGGWAELAWAATGKTRYHVGSTVDDPDNGDVASGRADRNAATYLGTVHDWSSGLRTGFDVIYWETDWKGNSDGDGYRLNLYFQYNF
jgi:hypothetical protein